MTSTTKWREI